MAIVSHCARQLSEWKWERVWRFPYLRNVIPARPATYARALGSEDYGECLSQDSGGFGPEERQAVPEAALGVVCGKLKSVHFFLETESIQLLFVNFLCNRLCLLVSVSL